MTQETPQTDSAQSATYLSLHGNQTQEIAGEVIAEALVCISLNGAELATLMASPHDVDQLALGFLANEGLIAGMDDVRNLHIARNGRCVDVWLHDTSITKPTRTIITAGCGGGVTFDDLSQQHPPLDASLTATPAQLADLMQQLHHGAALYQRTRGVHTAVLANTDAILLQAEDIGRHNCLDRLRGQALQQGIPTADCILLTSGRISSEMMNKARKMGAPIVCSRTSPTSLSVALAKSWQITLVAYLRQDRMRIYTHPERILPVSREP